nr:hypothetical protein [Tanacetum cinerariifolium]
MQHNASAIYHIRNVHPELPGREDRIVDFPEGKVGVYTSKRPRKNTPKCYTKPLDFLKNWNNCFFWVDERVFSTVVDWQTNVPKDGMPADGTYFVEAVRAPDMYRTPIQKQPELLLCVVRISRRYYLGDEVNRLIQFDSCPKSYEVARESRKRGHNGIDANAPPKSLRRDHADLRPSGSSHGGKSLAAIQLGLASNVFVPEGLPKVLLQQETRSLRMFLPWPKSSLREVYTGRNEVLPKQVSGEEKLKAAFEEFKRYEDDRVERRCVELDARLDALSIDFDEEIYLHMLTAIVGHRWVIGHGLRLAIMKCAESLEMKQAFADVVSAGVAKEHGQAQIKVESIEAYDPEAEAKFVAAL